MAERFKAIVLKTIVGESPPRVRIPFLPPVKKRKNESLMIRTEKKSSWKKLRIRRFPGDLPFAVLRKMIEEPEVFAEESNTGNFSPKTLLKAAKTYRKDRNRHQEKKLRKQKIFLEDD